MLPAFMVKNGFFMCFVQFCSFLWQEGNSNISYSFMARNRKVSFIFKKKEKENITHIHIWCLSWMLLYLVVMMVACQPGCRHEESWPADEANVTRMAGDKDDNYLGPR